MRFVIFCLLCCLSSFTFGQVKHAANWCFGKGAGIAFTDIGTNAIPCMTDNLEACASFSSSDGKLEFYISRSQDGLFNEIRNNIHQIVNQGDSIQLNLSTTNGGVFLTLAHLDSFVSFVHIGINPDSTGTFIILSLFETIINRSVFDQSVTTKNRILYSGSVVEKMTVVKHADGESWWVYVHGYTHMGCNSQYVRYRLLPNGGWQGPFIQLIGTNLCNGEGYIGEMTVSHNGKYLASSIAGIGGVDLFSINRCSGELEFLRTVYHPGSSATYGVAFSTNSKVLYFTTSWGGGVTDTATAYQYTLDSIHVSGGLIALYKVDSDTQEFGQLELGLDGKIYVAHRGGTVVGADTILNKCLSVINSPDLVGMACDFQPFSYCFTDTVKISYGLPHLPNFNLAPHPVFTTTAGPDTLYCKNGQGVMLGAPQVPNVLYQWNPNIDLSDPTIAQPLASPEHDTWYYLTATDTTAASCAVHVDSVLVQVSHCTGIDEQVFQNELKLFPNPAKDKLYIQGIPVNETISFQLLNLQGQQVYTQQLEQETDIDISQLASGIYIYTLTTQKDITTGKVVIE